MYITVQDVRDAGKLITSGAISDADIVRKIVDAEAYVNMCLAKLYLTPIVPMTKPIGTISVSTGTKTITGVGTLFDDHDDLLAYNHIYIVNSREVAVVASVTSNTVGASVNNFVTSATASEYYVIPEEICVAVAYYAVKLIYNWKFAEQGFNQDTDKPAKDYNDFAERVLNEIRGNKYYNASLTPQLPTQNPARAMGVYTGDNVNFDNNQAIINDYSSWWTL